MRLVFCGTPPFAVPTLEALDGTGHEIALVVTQPDRPHGRGLEIRAGAVKQRALALHLPITQPQSIKKNEELRQRLEQIDPEVIVVVAYGRIIPEWMLRLPKHGNLNLHASLLPKYRGAAPIQWAIANGETVSGNTTMRIDDGLDTGEILLQEQLAIAPEETSVSYAPQLAAAGARLMVRTLEGLADGSLHPRSQDNTQATLAPILTKEHGRIDFNGSAPEIYNRLRGFQPWPGIWTRFRGKQFAVRAAKPAGRLRDAEPGTVVVANTTVLVNCGVTTALELLEVQLESKQRMSARDFASGYAPDGERLG